MLRQGFVSLFLIAFSFLAFLSAEANVSIRNGNFYMGYKDIVYTGGFEPKIERVYNSKTAFKGIFGWGWGTEYEVYLTVSADGSVVVHEYGGGAENRFTPVKFKRKDLEKAVDRIVDAARRIGLASTQGQVNAYRAKLLKDAFFRNDEWEKFVKQGKLQRRRLSKGAQLTSNRFSYQYITKLTKGYRRTFDQGKTEEFNENGKLVKIQDKNNNYVKISYGKDGKISRIVDNFFRKILFTFNSKGLVSLIEGMNGKKARYSYDAANNLIQSRDVEENVYKYGYDKNHNLVGINYNDGSKLSVRYWGKEFLQNVRSIVSRDGTTTEYSYSDPKKKSKLIVGVRVKSKDGKVISKSSYGYFTRVKKTGEEWTYKMTQDLDGRKTETVYNECCGLPVMIKKNGQVTNFEYDRKGRVTKKDTPNEVSELKYHPSYGKVVEVRKFSKRTKRADWSRFRYDKRGNLITAKNSKKQGVTLVYDRNGRVRSLVDQRKRRIDFKYNENSRPIEITDPKLGSIRVKYSSGGEIKKVESDAGRRIAIQVTSAFQNLLDIIRPAGVNLNF